MATDDKFPLCIELLTAGLWHDSLGDKALELATQRGMGLRGIPAITAAKASGKRPCVIGGGHLIQCNPQVNNSWSRILDVFRVQGEHALNAVGLGLNGNEQLESLEYLRDYRYVSVRDFDSRDVLRSVGIKDIRVVPCTATLLDPLDWNYAKILPRLGFMNRLTESPYIVVHRDPLVERLLSKLGWNGPMVVVDPQEWRMVKWNSGGIELRTGSPEVLLSVMSRAQFVFGRSLHLGIFSICTGVPFRLIGVSDNDKQTKKIMAYFLRSGLKNVVVLPDEISAIRYLDMAEERSRLIGVRTKERVLVNKHLDDMASAIKETLIY